MEIQNKSYCRWTPEEESIIAEELAYCPNNISEGLSRASERLGRTYSSTRARWYSIMAKKENTVVFTLVGKESYNMNRKIVSSKTSDNTIHNNSIFTRIKKWLHLK